MFLLFKRVILSHPLVSAVKFPTLTLPDSSRIDIEVFLSLDSDYRSIHNLSIQGNGCKLDTSDFSLSSDAEWGRRENLKWWYFPQSTPFPNRSGSQSHLMRFHMVFAKASSAMQLVAGRSGSWVFEHNSWDFPSSLEKVGWWFAEVVWMSLQPLALWLQVQSTSQSRDTVLSSLFKVFGIPKSTQKLCLANHTNPSWTTGIMVQAVRRSFLPSFEGKHW